MAKKFDREIAWLKRDKYGGDEVRLRAHLKTDFKRLEKGEPIDYIIGWREFLGCKIDLSLKPFIPRAETEFWVEQAVKDLKAKITEGNPMMENHIGLPSVIRGLDLFAGSGCIGLAILKHCPNIQMTFGEKEEKFVKQIKKNLKINKIKARVVQTDIFTSQQPRRRSSGKFLMTVVGAGLGKFDFIFANPPYIPDYRRNPSARLRAILRNRAQKSVKDWEPKEALFAGPDGLTIIKKFLKQAKEHLKPKGKIYLEFGQGQKTKIEKLIKQFDYAHCRFYRDQFGKWRWVVIK